MRAMRDGGASIRWWNVCLIVYADGAASTGRALRFQIGTSNEGRGGRRYLPYAYTEQGIAMLSSVLRSETAVRVSVQIMRAFVEMRRFLAANAQVFERVRPRSARREKLEVHFKQVPRQMAGM